MPKAEAKLKAMPTCWSDAADCLMLVRLAVVVLESAVCFTVWFDLSL